MDDLTSNSDLTGDPFDFVVNQPLQKVAASVDDNPDDAARAVDLSKSTGVPAPVIHDDLSGFEQVHRTALTNQIMRSNPALIDYVRNNPMAASVSNDDWGALADVSQKGGALQKLYNVAKETVSGALEGASEGFMTKSALQKGIDDYYHDKPLAWALASVEALPIDGVVRGFNALMGAQLGAVKGGAESAYRAITGDEDAAKDFGQAAAENANIILIGSMFEAGPHVSGEIGTQLRQREAFQAGKQWFETGLTPPRGVHPAIDEALGELNSEGVRRLDEVLTAAQGSATRERSAEMFKDFVTAQHKDSTIGIHGDAVAALYGNKVPEAGDGLLGFVPNMGDQLLAAGIAGADVHVPIKDWLSQVSPEVAQQLHDDIRMFPGGITAREAQSPVEPQAMVDAPIAQVRAAGGLEPRFSLGDRRLTLEPNTDFINQIPPAYRANLYNQKRYWLIDSTGQRKGELHLFPDAKTKELYVDDVALYGTIEDSANSIGPAAVRDLLKQIQQEYPGYTLTGTRVTGAREAADAVGKTPEPKIKLNLDEATAPKGLGEIEASEPKKLRETDETWRQLSVGSAIKVSPVIDDIVHQELRRIVGQYPELVPADQIYIKGVRPYGVFQARLEEPPIIAWNVLNPSAISTARHEAIHYLRGYGFFSPQEWAALEDHALKNDWLGYYNIRRIYGDLSTESQLEEAIAEGYRDWAGAANIVTEPTGLVAKAFQRMKDLWEAIKSRINSALGKEVDIPELLQAIHEGAVARRRPKAEQAIEGVLMPKFSLSEEDFNNLKANAVGLDAKSYKNLQEAIKARHESDLVAAVKRAEKEQKQTQTAEWKANLTDVRKEVEATLKQRPDIAADLFVNSGEFEGTKLRQRIPLRATDLTDEQKATLPRTYYSRDGLPVEEVARLFGYQDAGQLLENLGDQVAKRGDRTPAEHLKAQVDEETHRQMQQRYGNLESNIMEAAVDQALSDADLNLLAEEYHAAGMLAGQATIDKNVIKAQAREAFDKMTLSAVSSQRLIAEMGRHGRDTERALIPGQEDPAAALKSMERKLYTGMLAVEARKLEKEMKTFDRTAKRLAKREVTNLPQPYTNFIHQILAKVGKPIQRTALDLRTEIAEHGAEHTLEAFVDDLNSQLQVTEVWDQLYDSSWGKPYKELSVGEFRNVKDSVDNLAFIGRQIGKVYRAGAEAELSAVKNELVTGLQDFGVKHYDIKGGRWMGPVPPSAAKWPRMALANSLTMETIFNRWDRGDQTGPWTQFGIRPLIEAASDENVTKREFANKLKEIYSAEDDAKLKQGVYNPLFRDTIGGNLLSMTRENLRTVMLNTGSRGGPKSNLTKLAKGYGLQEADILSWIDNNATKADWDWCQKIWDLHGELWVRAQRMRRQLSGVGAKSLEVPEIQTPFGTQRGGYYPIIYSEVKQSAKSLTEGLEGPGFVRATTFDGYAQERTAYYAPINLTLDPMPNRLGQIIHDITMRPAVLNAAKLFYNTDIKTAISRYYGKEYSDLLVPYLRDVANVTNYKSEAQSQFGQLLNAIQKNLIVSLIGANIGTVMKHTPTAFVTSMYEVGPLRFLDAVKSLHSINDETGQKNLDFAMERSEELRNRQRNWVETLTGVSGEFVPGQGMGQWRQKIAELSSKPVAFGDMMSAVPTWLAAYRKAIEDGNVEGDARFSADRAVRRAHGSSAITNKAGVQRNLPSFVTSFYTFFNDILNRQAEVVWKAADALGAVKDHNWSEAKAALAPIAGGIFATVIWPAIVEQAVSPTGGAEEGWAKKAGKGLAHSLTSSWIGVRDFANWMLEGRDPSLGLYSTAYHELGDMFKDFGKQQPMSKEHAGRLIRDTAGFVGVLSGLVPLAAGKATQFAFGTAVGTEHPRGPWGWAAGLRYGTLTGHSGTYEDWRKGR